MKIGNKIGINPEAWGDKKYEDFEKMVKGKLPIGLTVQKAWEQFSESLPKAKDKPKGGGK